MEQAMTALLYFSLGLLVGSVVSWLVFRYTMGYVVSEIDGITRQVLEETTDLKPYVDQLARAQALVPSHDQPLDRRHRAD